MQAEARLLVLTLGQPSRPGWPFSRKGGRRSQTTTGCDCHKRDRCLQLTAQGLRKLTRAREKQSWLEAAGPRAGRGVSGPGAGGGQLLLWKSQLQCGWPRTRGQASPWRRGQSVASLRLALQLRQEQLGGGRLLPTAETRKVPSPLNKHTRVLGHREMLGETGMPSVRCGGGRGGHRTGRCGARSRLQASERVGSRHLQGQRGGAPEKSAICLRD